MVEISTPDDPERDDAGREDDSPGFDIQARIFALVGTFMSVVSIVYGFLTYEWAGTVMLVLSSALAFTIGAYIGWDKPNRSSAAVDEPGAPQGHDDEEPWFPSSSGWPFALGVGLVLVANGLLLGVWLLLPAGAFLAFALAGFIHQSRVRG